MKFYESRRGDDVQDVRNGTGFCFALVHPHLLIHAEERNAHNSVGPLLVVRAVILVVAHHNVQTVCYLPAKQADRFGLERLLRSVAAKPEQMT